LQISLPPDEIQLWLFPRSSRSLSAYLLGSLDDMLSPDEHSRARSHPDPNARQQVAWNHALLRSVLALYFDTAPSDLVLEANEHGKPYLNAVSTDEALHFNYSHTSSWVLLGCTRSAPLGVDVEKEREESDLLRLAHRFFNLAEAEYLAELPQHKLAAAFFDIWTVKEALLKAVGHGFSMASQTFETAPTLSETIFDLECPSCVSTMSALNVGRVHDPRLGAPSEWAGLRFRIGKSHHACIAIRQNSLRICFPQLDSKWRDDMLPAALGLEL
jgi:4'-phosphopantetheinyl transferase